MSKHEQTSQIERIESLARVLQQSSIGELELIEDGTEIIIRRQSRNVTVTHSILKQSVQKSPISRGNAPDHVTQEEHSAVIVAPFTGVFYTSPSPTLPPFIKVGDYIQRDQVIGLIEAMKVFSEIQADIAGRLIQIVAVAGSVVKKGDVLLRIEPL
jgi:acetyl-CoA carboxylase biotin carboxyl carrier protein